MIAGAKELNLTSIGGGKAILCLTAFLSLPLMELQNIQTLNLVSIITTPRRES